MARTRAAHSSRSSRVPAKKRPLGIAPRQWPGAPHSLQSDRDRPRRTDLHHQIHRANIDPKLQRSRRHQHFDFAFFQFSFGVQTQLA